MSRERLPAIEVSIVTTWYETGSMDAKAKFRLESRKPLCSAEHYILIPTPNRYLLC